MRSESEARLNVLLTEDRPHAPEHWTSQLSRLLEPQGVAAYLARSGREAVAVAERVRIHAAVIDLGTPLGAPAGSHGTAGTPPRDRLAGLWLLELLRRLPHHPPIIVVRGPVGSHAQVQRVLREALRLGAFSVINKPVDVEQILTLFRRVVDRKYRGYWPPRPTGEDRPIDRPGPHHGPGADDGPAGTTSRFG